jgi:sulfide:quinone oxidoreductase
MAITPPEPTPVPTGVPKTGFMTVRMAKTAAAAIYADIKGTPPPPESEIEVICIMDMGNTAAMMKASPVLPPRQVSFTRKGRWARALKVFLERYFMYKMRHGMSALP